MAASGTRARRAAFSAVLSAGLRLGAKRWSPVPVAHAWRTAFKWVWHSLEPATRAATFCSSTTFQLM